MSGSSALAKRQAGLYKGDTFILMPYFHATAVFEARGSSAEEADRAVVTLFKTLRHPRVLYYEHDTSGEAAPHRPPGPLYTTVIADFDIEASNEENAADMVEEALDTLSTADIQYLAHGITLGERRVRPEQRAQRAAEQAPERETHAEQEEREERGGRKRGGSGRGRKRGGPREVEGARAEEAEAAPPSPPQQEPAETLVYAEMLSPAVPAKEEAIATVAMPEPAQAPSVPMTLEAVAPSPPPRSSAAMRVTLTVTLHASELALPTNGSTLPDQQELISLATVEARRRHPELPADVTPECEVVSLPWGDTVLTLTWHYDVPVPSAADAA